MNAQLFSHTYTSSVQYWYHASRGGSWTVDVALLDASCGEGGGISHRGYRREGVFAWCAWRMLLAGCALWDGTIYYRIYYRGGRRRTVAAPETERSRP